MPFLSQFAALGALLLAAVSTVASAAPKTVCTITVNSPDERESFRRHLPPGDYRFVELVERGRPDWLASACRQRVTCDALIISGHFDGGTEFYTDRLDQGEYLSVEQMERASCSDSCPGVFSQLKEVYLFGCNTLKPQPQQAAGEELVRALLRAGHAPGEALERAGLLGERHARSNRDRMRHIFKDVPVIYGFSSLAPLGRSAGPLLDRYFQQAPAGEVGSGKVSGQLLSLFAPSSMTATAGLAPTDPQATLRSETCNFLDDRLADSRKLAFMHEVLQRDMAEVRMFLADLERFVASIGPAQRDSRETAEAFSRIAGDTGARARYLEFARDADEPAVRIRMMSLARSLGWLSVAQEEAELLQMLADQMARGRLGRDEVDLPCSRQPSGENTGAVQALEAGALASGQVAPVAALACLGSREAHARVLRAVMTAGPDDLAMAQAYLRHRPVRDAGELRALATAVVGMADPQAQARALDMLAQQRLGDPQSLRDIVRLFALTRSLQVQRAIAGVLIRSDFRVLEQAELARTLRQHRLRSDDGEDVVDALLRLVKPV